MKEYRPFRLVHFILGGPDLDPPVREYGGTYRCLSEAEAVLRGKVGRTGSGGIEVRDVGKWRDVG